MPPFCFSLALVLALSLRSAATEPGAAGGEGKAIVRGITISTHRGGRDWGSDNIVPTLEEIRAVGANWVSIHPYARIEADGSVHFRDFDPDSPPAYLVRPIEEAHRLGLSICIKPHLAYWGSSFAWRGDIEFDGKEERRRFWRDYRRWILKLAAACRKADGFVVGTEIDRMLGDADQWRALIAAVRRKTAAPLTYAANWSEYRRVSFWDALDVVGIQAYFPLTDEAGADIGEIRKGWKKRMRELRRYAEKTNRNILFTELGYSRSFQAPVRPWSYHLDGAAAAPVQEACLQTALEAIASEPCVVGVLLWKWFTYPHSVGRDFQLATPRLRRLIARSWLGTE